MPGSIRVSVLESVDLPPEATGGKYVSIKVSIGKREFQTRPSEVNGGKTAAWNSDFAFPVLNLRDNLMVAVLDSKGNAISQTEIGTPIIVEKGSLEELFPLKGGGCVHLRISLVLTLEERMRIEAMRNAALAKKHRIVSKNATIQVLNSAEENRTSALASGTVISQSIPRDVISKDESYNDKNQITTIVVPQVSLPNEMEKKTETTERASLSPISSPIESVIHKETSSHDSKDISDQNLEENGCQYLPVNELEEAASTASSKELTPPIEDSSLLSCKMAFPKYESEKVMQANTLLANENTMLAQLPHVKDSLAELENSEAQNFTDKFSVIETAQIEFEKNDATSIITDMVVSETPSQDFFTSHVEQETCATGSVLCQENRTLSIASSRSCPLPDSSDRHGFVNLATQFHGGTPDIPSESNSFSGFDGTTNTLSVITSSEEGIATSSLSTFPNVLPSQSSRDGSISLSPLVDSPGDATGEKTIPFPSFFPESTQLDQNFQPHPSIHSTKIPNASTAYEITSPDKEIVTASHSDSDFCTEDLCMDQTSAIVIDTENTERFAQDICLTQSNTTDSSYKFSKSDTGNGSLSGKETEGVCEASSLQAVPCQLSSTAKGLTESVSSNVPQLIDNKVHIVVSTSFPNPLASHTIIGDGRQSSVKAKIKVFESTLSSQTKKGFKQSGVKEKIKVFESSLSQDPDCNAISSLKTNHKIEAERARQRLREDAASAEAAEARRRAEEEEAKMKSIAEGREGNMGFQQRREDLRFTKPAKLKRKYLERNEEGDKRHPQKDVKNITISKEDVRKHETFREKEEGTLRKHLNEKGENLLRAIESKETMTEDDCRQRAVNWEMMRLGELQLKRNFQGKIVKPDLSEKENEVVEKSLMDESIKVSWSSKASKQKHDVGVQAGESQLIKAKARRSVTEARPTTNGKEKKGQESNHDLIIEQTVHSMTPGRSSAEDMSTEKDPTIMDEKLEDLVNGSTEFGGFIKQALGAAALLAAGALFMWLRGQTMNGRRSRMAQSSNQYYFLPNGEATSRSLQGEFDEPNLRISDFSPEVMKIEEVPQIGRIQGFRLANLGKKLEIETKRDTIESRVHFLNEEERYLESIVRRERQQLQTLVHSFCMMIQRLHQDIVLDKDELCGPIHKQRNLDLSLMSTESQLQHAHIDNSDKLQVNKFMFLAPTTNMLEHMGDDSTLIEKLQGNIKDLREKSLDMLNYVKEIELRRRMVHEELDMLSGATQGDPNKILYSQYVCMPYSKGTLKYQNLRLETSSNLNKRCCVCLSNLQNDGFYGLQCNHLYHFSCLLIYIIGQNKCATCKDVISYETYLNLGIEDFIPKEQILDGRS